jgi:rfaE bifunctional protein kinase chain/domain
MSRTSYSELAADIRRKAAVKSIALVHGNFNVVHPGHLRLLNFAAECADYLVVAIYDKTSSDAFIEENLRLNGIQAISVVDDAFLLPPSLLTPLIKALKPEVIVKGKEHENKVNIETELVDSYGGKLIFGAGEAQFSSLDLLRREFSLSSSSRWIDPNDYFERQGIKKSRLKELVSNFSKLKVAVIGDLIVDEYITCDPLGMSREDPTIVVTPIQSDRFVGGAGIVSAHAKGLGADVAFFGVAGDDEIRRYSIDRLAVHGVDAYLAIDASRPTTLKQRYRAGGKTLLRVSHLRQHDIAEKLQGELLERLLAVLDSVDLLVFSDFNYGILPQRLVDRVTLECKVRSIPVVADSQASSQVADISRFRGMHLITPTEHEARLALRDGTSGLVALAESLRVQSLAKHVIVTLGAEGLLIQSAPEPHDKLQTDQLPALNSAPKDVAGAGDSLLTCAALAIAAGGTIWEASYLGSIAAACQVGRLGNIPLQAAEVLQSISE